MCSFSFKRLEFGWFLSSRLLSGWVYVVNCDADEQEVYVDGGLFSLILFFFVSFFLLSNKLLLFFLILGIMSPKYNNVIIVHIEVEFASRIFNDIKLINKSKL